ncbi:MAG: PAS domain S-box protein [Vicinamibacterales bacterium]
MTRRLPIRISIPLGLALISIVLTGAGIAYDRYSTYRTLEQTTLRRATSVAHIVVPDLERALMAGRTGDALEELDRLALEPSITRAAVVDADGTILHATDPALVGQSLASSSLGVTAGLLAAASSEMRLVARLTPSGGHAWVAAPMHMAPVPGELAPSRVAVLFTETDITNQKRTALEEIVTRSGLLAVFALLACLLVWWYLHRTFTSDLGRIVESLHAVGGSAGADRDPAELAQIEAALRGLLGTLAREHAVRRDSEEKFSRIFESAPVMISLSEIATGQFIDINDAGVRMLGYSREEIIGRTSVELGWFSAEERQAMLAALSRDGRVDGLDVIVHRKDGDGLECVLSAEVVTIEGTPRLLVLCQDLTDYKRAQRVMLTQERQFRELLDRAPVPIGLVRDGRVDYVNAALMAMNGFRTVDDAIGAPVGAWVAPEERDAFVERARRRVRGETVAERYETIGIRQDGTRFPMLVNASLVQLADGPAVIAFAQDMSEERAREQRLADSEARLRLLFDEASDAIIIHDRNGRIVDVNRQAVDSVGYTREQLLRMSVLELEVAVSETDLRAMWRDLPVGSGITAVGRHRRSDGHVIDVEVHACAFVADSQELIFAATRDVTRRLDGERRLRASESRFRELFDQAADAAFILTPSMHIVDVNQKAVDVLGYTRDELLRMHVADLETTVGRTELVAMAAYVEAHGEQTVTGVHRRKDGSLMPVEVHSVRFLDTDGAPFLYSLCRDISDRVDAQRHLRDSEARFRAVVENSHDGIIFTDREGNITWRSPAYSRLNGFEGDERIGQSGFETIHPDDLPLVRSVWAQMLTEPGTVVSAEYRVRHKDGSWRWLDTSARNLLDNPHVGAVVLTSRDITERRRAEEERRGLEEQLAQARRIEAVGRLAGGVAHDFNNMLNVILGCAELSLAELPEGNAVRADLLEIQRAAERSSGLTRQLLAFARQQPVAPRVLDLNIAVEEVLAMLRRLIGENITLSWEPGASLEMVLIDPTQIDQLLANLCVNARDAIKGVGSISIATGSAVLDETFCASRPGSSPGAYVRLSVRDTGEGMSDEVLTHIFEPFFTTKGMGKGTGLGLATVYGIVTQNQGFIDVESVKGAGTTFAIFLPAQRAEAGRGAVEEAPAVRTPEHGTILLVEDEQAVLQLTERVLGRLGYTVVAAHSPRRALALADAYDGQFDLLMTDVIMPEMNGRELLAALREKWPRLRCLFTSGYTAEVIAEQGGSREEVALLRKPWTRDDLAARVRSAIRGEPPVS